MNIRFSKEIIQVIDKHMKTCSTFLDIRDVQSKTTVYFNNQYWKVIGNMYR